LLKDAHEFLCQVLDQLKDDFDKKLAINTEKTNNCKENSQQKQQKDAAKDDEVANAAVVTDTNNKESKKKKKENNKETASFQLSNPVVDNFLFEVQHSIICKK
jgi:hypothetical protein